MHSRSIFTHLPLLLTLTLCVSMIILVYPLSTAIGAQNESPIPRRDIPEITPGELLIRVTPEAQAEVKRLYNKAPLQKLHRRMGVQSYHRVFPYIAHPELNPNLERIYLLRFPISTDLHALKVAYAAQPLIEAAEFNYLRPAQATEIIPNDPRFEEQWNLPLINMPRAWAIEKGDPSVIIAIVDSGVDYKHQDLASQIWVNVDEIPDNGIDDDGNGYIDDVRGWDFTDAPNVAGEGDFMDSDNEPLDESGHGTHVAGIAGAAVDNGIGVAGVAWNCTLMPVRSGGGIGGGTRQQDDDSSAGIVYAVDNGARVINMSWGSRERNFVIRDVIDYAYARGVLLVAAAGNDLDSTVIFPASYRKVIAVAATAQNKQRFYQSNFGAAIDIGAPGNVILSTQINNAYRLLTGTSMATPHVAAVAALIMSKRPNLTHEEVRAILVSTADPITESPDLVGAGNLNAERALMASGSLQARILAPESNAGGSNEIEIIGSAGGLKFSTWQLMYGESPTPTRWFPINASSRQQKANERLLVWDTSDVPENIYSLRLEVFGEDGKVVRDEVIVSVDRTPPQLRNVKARELITRNGFTTFVTWSTDDFTINTLRQRARGRRIPFSPLEESGASNEHAFSFPLSAGSYDIFITSRNAAGLETIDNNGGKFYRVEARGGAISPNGFVDISPALSRMHLGSVAADFDRDGQLEIVGLPLTGDAVSGIEIYERSAAGAYQLQHTGTTVYKPWAVDDTDGDGLLEILGSSEGRTFLIESTSPNGYPERLIWESSLISSGQIVDLDGDGRKEIIGPDNNNREIRLFENRENDTYEQIISLKNETDGANVLGEQFAIGDFNKNGKLELMVGDSEGELFVYESTGNDLLVETWRNKIDVKNAHQLGTGDLTGDGIPEFVVGGTVSEEDLPSVVPSWEYRVFTAFPPADTLPKAGQNGISAYTLIWSQEIHPFRSRGNSVAIGDVDGDSQNELVILVNPSAYVFKWESALDGGQSRPTFNPIWHHDAGETPHLILADLNQNTFSELYFNDRENLLVFEDTRAGNPNTVVDIQPWDVSATPLTPRVVRVDWRSPGGAGSFTVYRAIGKPEMDGDSTPPQPSEFEVLVEDLESPGILDRKIKTDTTYWYAVTAKNAVGVETDRTEPISVTPRIPPKLIAAEHIGSNQAAVTFDKQMGVSVGNTSSYVLREPEQLVGVQPSSVIRDRMGRRAILTFQAGDLIPGGTYEISVQGVQDIDRNPIDLGATTQTFEVPTETDLADLKNFAQTIVYPNPVRPNEFHKSAVTFDRVPTGTTIEVYNSSGELLERLAVTASDRGRKEWLLLNNGTSEVTSGIYIYVMEFEKLKKVGKIAVIK